MDQLTLNSRDIAPGEQPDVSVIMPVYNTEEYVAEALRSVIGQTHRNIEIIVIDDGSTDGSRQVVRDTIRGDRRARCITQQNQGQAEARNVGMRQARGRYVYFMDSDDVLVPDALECCVRQCDAGELDFLLFDASNFGQAGTLGDWADYTRARYFAERPYTGIEALELLLGLGKYRVPTWLNLIRMDFLRRCGLSFLSSIRHEDELFTDLMYLHAARVEALDRVLLMRRIRPGSVMTTRFSAADLRSYLTIADQLRLFAMRHAHCRVQVRALLRRMLNPVVRHAADLPGRDRRRLLPVIMLHYAALVSPRNIAVLIFKAPLSKLRRHGIG
ncbi:MAG: glycosyltransferase [Rikenellaceae bacterium]|nr:glycosyltransferase [Rikenellaceae bacterium]